MLMKIDFGMEKWLYEESKVTNGKLSEWLHYVKMIREKTIHSIDNIEEKLVYDSFFASIEEEFTNAMTRLRPKPNLVKVNVNENH